MATRSGIESTHARRAQSRLAGTGHWRMHALAAALAAAWGGHASALPTGAQPVAGNVSIARPDAATLNVTQGSPKAIVNWSGFSVGRGEAVNFAQPDATSMILNRVIGGSYSEILGRISANGQVFLVNPLGVTLGTGAHVDAAGFVASTLSISDNDFLAGRHVFSNAGNAGAVVNRGVINTGTLAALLGPQVSNEGTISARLGTVGLAAGDRVALDFRGDGLVKFSVDKAAVDASVSNQGALIAEGGHIVMTAQSANAMLDTVINMRGVARATALAERNGTIVLDGGTTGVVAVSGTLDASGRAAGEHGGTVKVLGDKVGLFDGAQIDAAGDRGGGTVLVGGNWQGKGSERNSSATFASADASITADALTDGKGGTVVLWSDGVTRAGVDIKARGGARGGDGGAVEVSGKQYLEFAATVDTTAPAGKFGMLLLDPTNLTIVNAGATDPQVVTAGNGAAANPFRPSVADSTADGVDDSRLRWSTIEGALAANNVVITTVSSPPGFNVPDTAGQDGTITIAQSSPTMNSTNSLTFNAAGNIVINASIENTGTGGMTFTAAGGKSISLKSGEFVRNGGAISMTGPAGITLAGDITTTAGGSVTVNGPVVLNGNVGIDVSTAGGAGSAAVSFGNTVNSGATARTLTVTLDPAGSATFTGAVGNTAPLQALTISGTGATNVNGGSVNTVAAQTYGGILNLGAPATVLQASNATATGGIDGNNHDLTLTFSGVATINAATFTNVDDFVSNGGGGSSLSGTITTAGSQTYSNLVTLTGATRLIGTTGTLSGGVAGGTNSLQLSFSQPSTLSGASFTNISNLTVDGGSTTTLSGTFTTSGAQQYVDAVLLGGTTVLDAPTVTFNSTVGTAGNALTLTTDTLTVSGPGTISGGGALTFQPRADATPMTIDNTVLSAFADGFSSVTLGRATGTALTTVNAVALNDPTVIRQGGGGTITVAGNITGAGDASVALNAGAGGAVNLNADIALPAAVAFTGAVTLGGGPRSIAAGAGDVTFNQALTGAQPLVVTSTGTTRFSGAVTGLTSLTTNGVGGTTAINTPIVTTTGAQTYDHAVTLEQNTVLTSAGAPITFNGTVSGARSLTVDTLGDTTFNAAVGSPTPLSALITQGGGFTRINGGSVNAGTQTYNDAVTLGSVLTTFTGTSANFLGGIDGGGNDLTLTFSGPATINGGTFTNVDDFVSNGSGGTNLSGIITTGGSQTYTNLVTLLGPTQLVGTAGTLSGGVAGGANDLQLSFSAPSTLSGGAFANVNNLVVDGGGTTTLSGALTTSGGQQYVDSVLLGAGTVLTSTGGGAIVFNSTVDGAQTLAVTTTGTTTFNAAVGATTPLSALTIAGPLTANGGLIDAGTQTYNGATTLGAPTQFRGTTGTFTGGIAGGGFDLTLDFSGASTLNGASFSNVDNLSVGGGGTTSLTGTITTAGSQTYGDDLTLTGATTLVSTGNQAIALNGAVDGAQTLQVNTTGATNFGGAVGAGTALTSVQTDAGGTTTISGSGIRTSGLQTYNDAVVVTGAATLASTGAGAIDFNSTVDGPGTLAVNTAGTTRFNGSVGTTTAALGAVSTDAPGTTQLNGASVTTTGNQSYNDAVVLGAATTLTSTAAGSIAFGGTLNGAQTLAVNTAGAASFGGLVGGVNPLASITTDSGGTTAINTAAVTTTGAQSYGDAVTLTGATTFVTSGSPISLGSSLAAPAAVTASGATTLDVAQATGNLTVVLATPVVASVNANGNLSVQGAANQTITLGNSSAGGTLNVDAAGTGSIVQIDGTRLQSGGNLRLRAPNGEMTLADITSGTRIELNNTGPSAGLVGEGKVITMYDGAELNAPFVRLVGGFNGLGPDNNSLGSRTMPIRFGDAVTQVDYAAPLNTFVFFAGPPGLQQSRRIFLITPPGGQDTFDYNGGSGRVASNVAGEVVGSITSQITSQVESSFRPGRIDQAILFGFQGDLSLPTPPVFGAITGVMLPPVIADDPATDERKRR